jgi:hypothetical protein
VERAGADRSRDEHDVAPAEVIGALAVLDKAFTFGANKQTGHSGGTNRKRQLPTYAPQAEIFTIKGVWIRWRDVTQPLG